MEISSMDFTDITVSESGEISVSGSDIHTIIEKLQPVIFKYRNWKNDYHKTILTDQIVYYASPKEFEDNKDCMIRKQFELMTDDDLFKRYLDSSTRLNPLFTEAQHHQYAIDWTRKSPLKNKENLAKIQHDYLELLNKRWGILSLTKNPVSIEMWEKYGDNHEGFCVGFLTAAFYLQTLGFLGDVKYTDELPEILHDDSPEVEAFKQIYCKERHWAFEQEIRSAKVYWADASKNDRTIKLEKGIFFTIIFGAKMSEAHKGEIRSVCQIHNLKVDYHEVINQDGNYFLSLIPNLGS